MVKRSVFFRLVAVACTAALIIQTGAAAIGSVGHGIAGWIRLLTQERRPAFTDRPTRVWLGRHPGKDIAERGGLYDGNKRAALLDAAQKWRGNRGGGGLFAMVTAELPPMLTGSEGGGAVLPGEGSHGGGGIGGGTINTHTGNFQKDFTLTGWPCKGGMSAAFTLYHNSLSDYDQELGPHWSHTYGAKLSCTDWGASNEQVAIRYGDGTPVVYQKEGGIYKRPNGIFDNLTKLSSPARYRITTKDQTTIDFPDPGGNTGMTNMSLITDRNGFTLTISLVSGTTNVDHVTEDATGRYLDLDYDTSARINKVTDPSGRHWDISYDTNGDLHDITFPTIGSTNPAILFGYDSGHKITSETNLEGHEWTYDYDTSDRIWRAYPPSPFSGHYTQYAYTSEATTITNPDSTTCVDNYDEGMLASQVDEAEFSVAYSYTKDRLLETLVDKRGNQWQFSYDGMGNLLTKTDPLSKIWANTYSSTNNLLTAEDPLGNIWISAYDGNGNLTTVTDPEGRLIQTNTYNSTTHLLEKTWIGGTGTGTWTTWTEYGYSYSSGCLTLTVTRPQTSSANSTSIVVYDVLGNALSTTDGLNNTTEMSYDNWKRLTQVSYPAINYGSGSVHDKVGYAYDKLGNVTKITDERGKETTFEYDEKGRRTDENYLYGTSTSGTGNHTNVHTEYNYRDLPTSITHETTGSSTVARTFIYNVRGETYSVTLPDDLGEGWTYNANGQVTLHSYFLESSGETFPEETCFDYDIAGRLTERTNGVNSDTATLDYDDADRMTEMVDPSGTSTWSYFMDGQLDTVTTPQGNVSREYDDYGRLENLVDVGTSSYGMQYGYDVAGRVYTVKKDFPGTYSETTGFAYDYASRLVTQTDANGIHTDFGYDVRNRATSIEHKNGTTVLAKEINTFDPGSRITQRITGAGSYITTDFTYDDPGQLTREAVGSVGTDYTYDKNGNRLTKVDASGTTTYTSDGADKLTALDAPGTTDDRTFDYDIAGRTLHAYSGTTAVKTYSWDTENRLTTIAGTTFSTVTNAYNAMGARVSRTVSSTTTTFKRANPDPVSPVLSETVGTGSPTRFVPGISERNGSTSLWYHSGIKNDIAQSNDTPAVANSLTYDAFGVQTGTSGTWSGRFKYGGKFGYQTEADAELKLLGNRWYDPSLGRFLSRDIAKHSGNWYVYCEGNPIGAADQDGKCPALIVVIGFIVAAVMATDNAEAPAPWDTATDRRAHDRDLGVWKIGLAVAVLGVPTGVADVAGIIVGGIAGKVIGRFVEKLLVRQLEKLSELGSRSVTKDGLSAAARSLEKHWDRTPGVYPKPIGTTAEKNRAGKDILDDILFNPDSQVLGNRGKGGIFTDVFAPDGRHARFGPDYFKGFREPPL